MFRDQAIIVLATVAAWLPTTQLLAAPPLQQTRVVGYYTAWSIYARKFEVSQVPADKLTVLATAVEWGVHLGYPGVANPAIGQVFGERIISSMFARVALGEMTAEESVEQAAARVEEIFSAWRDRGLVGGGE